MVSTRNDRKNGKPNNEKEKKKSSKSSSSSSSHKKGSSSFTQSTQSSTRSSSSKNAILKNQSKFNPLFRDDEAPHEDGMKNVLTGWGYDFDQPPPASRRDFNQAPPTSSRDLRDFDYTKKLFDQNFDQNLLLATKVLNLFPIS